MGWKDHTLIPLKSWAQIRHPHSSGVCQVSQHSDRKMVDMAAWGKRILLHQNTASKVHGSLYFWEKLTREFRPTRTVLWYLRMSRQRMPELARGSYTCHFILCKVEFTPVSPWANFHIGLLTPSPPLKLHTSRTLIFLRTTTILFCREVNERDSPPPHTHTPRKQGKGQLGTCCVV